MDEPFPGMVIFLHGLKQPPFLSWDSKVPPPKATFPQEKAGPNNKALLRETNG